ncbi:MAG TPA: MFS transporter [Vicinamibacteria bacterium]
MSARPYHALRHRDFRRLWLSQLVSQIGGQMQVVALNWHVYLLTHSALALGFVGLTRVVPIIVFSLISGVVADRRDRRRVMLAAQTGMTLVALALAGLTFLGHDQLLMLYGLNALQASAAAFDNPSRQSLIPRLVPVAELPGALSLNLTAFHVAMIGGPALAGLLIAGGGASLLPTPSTLAASHAGPATGPLAWIYLLNALSFLGVIATLLTLRTSGKVEPQGAAAQSHSEALREGLRFVFSTPILVWTLALDFFATFFSGAMSLLPIVADQVLHVGPAGYGWLVAAPAFGAVVGSLYTSLRPLPRRQGIVLLVSVGLYGAATVTFGLSRTYWLTLAALAFSGLADLVSTVIRQTLRQLITPDALRGRMTSVNMIFFMGGPQLGEMEAGLVASLFASAAVGVTVSIVSGGLATILCALVIAAATPVVRRYGVHTAS